MCYICINVKGDNNLNDTLDNSLKPHLEANLEQNFETNLNNIVEMGWGQYDYATLIELLLSDKIEEKQIAALNLPEIESNEDAKILVSNLVGQDGKVREAVAFKVNELFKNPSFRGFFNDEKIYALLLQGIMDINGNVCRQIVELTIDYDFGQYLCKYLPKCIIDILLEIKKIDAESKQYVISKRNFQLYWALEALYNIIDKIELNKVKNILLQSGVFYDYTIREKIAKILTKVDDSELSELKNNLKNDENYYVRRYLN